jgi:phosphatidylglycerophosphate synthase
MVARGPQRSAGHAVGQAAGQALATSRWLTRANALSFARLAAVPLLVGAVLSGAPGTAAALLALAIATDLADGAVARRYGESSPLGGLLDHAIDATLCGFGLAAWAVRGDVPWALPPLVAAAFLQYALDSRSLAGRPLRGSPLGRWNGLAYYVLLAVPIGRDVLALGWPSAAWTRAAGWLLAISTLVSMADRLRRRGSD